MEAPRAGGEQITVGEMARTGFPIRIAAALRDIAIVSPAEQGRLEVPEVTVAAPTYWPGHAKMDVPAGDIAVITPGSIATLPHEGGQAAVVLRPGRELTLQSKRAIIANPHIDLVEGRVLSARVVHATLSQQETPAQNQSDFNAFDLAPGSILRQAARLPNSWPVMFDAFHAAGTITMERPIERTATLDNRPQPVALKLETAQALWGEIGMVFSADVTVAQGGIMTGTMSLSAQNWPRMLDFAECAGALTADTHPQIESVLTLLAGVSGGGPMLAAQITVLDGQMSMGCLPLGPAPRLIFR